MSEVEPKLCWACKYARKIAGDCHIRCGKPPSVHLEIGAGGNERYVLAATLAKEKQAVVRCIWPGSGFYPLAFDGNTVFGCANFEEGKSETPADEKGIFAAFLDTRYNLSD